MAYENIIRTQIHMDLQQFSTFNCIKYRIINKMISIVLM